MSARIAVYVYGTDLVSQAGVAAQLRGRPETYVVDDSSIDDAVVAVVVVDAVDEGLARIVRGIQREGCPRVVLVTTAYDNADLVVAIEAGVIDVLLRQDVTPELLARSVVLAARPDGARRHLGAAGHAIGPATRHDRVRAARADELSSREVQVLQLLADGLDTQEIAERLAYSERTIKGIIHGVTTRLNLRNRAHAVAYAIKSGVL